MVNLNISNIKARQVIDCRGEPTVETDVILECGALGRASVPVGRSTSSYEATDLRDGNSKYYFGRSVQQAVKNVNDKIAPKLIGRKASSMRENDLTMIELDGTKDKSKLGANAILAVSIASAKAAANALEVPFYRFIGGEMANVLPVPSFDMIEGGKLASSDLNFQEHQVIPVGAKSFAESLRYGDEVYHVLADIVSKKWGKYSLNVGVEGGYTPANMKDPRDALDSLMKAVSSLGYDDLFALGLDAAATHFYNKKKGKYNFMGKELDREEMLSLYEEIVSAYPVISIEDPLYEDDYEGFAEATRRLKIQIIGDDLFVTNTKRLAKGIKMGAGNALLLKANQIGTLSETVDASIMAQNNGYNVQVSERSGQTEDTWLAHLTVATNAGQIKTGCPARGERTSQYNELLRIEEELGTAAKYKGKAAFFK